MSLGYDQKDVEKTAFIWKWGSRDESILARIDAMTRHDLKNRINAFMFAQVFIDDDDYKLTEQQQVLFSKIIALSDIGTEGLDLLKSYLTPSKKSDSNAFVNNSPTEFSKKLYSSMKGFEQIFPLAENEVLKDFKDDNGFLPIIENNILRYIVAGEKFFNMHKNCYDVKSRMDKLSNLYSTEFKRQEVNFSYDVEPANLSYDLAFNVIPAFINNAFDHAKDMSEIKVLGFKNGPNYELYHIDNGPGIPEDKFNGNINNVYTKASTRNGGVHGLGLKEVSDFITERKGKPVVENISSEGAKFGAIMPLENIVLL